MNVKIPTKLYRVYIYFLGISVRNSSIFLNGKQKNLRTYVQDRIKIDLSFNMHQRDY